MVLIGALCMLAAIRTSLRTTPDIPGQQSRQWRILTLFMGFFFVGYLAFILVEARQIPLPSELITGGVFLGGACFVLIILNLTRTIVHSLREHEHELTLAKNELEHRVEQRTHDLEEVMKSLRQETKQHQQLSTELNQVLDNAADGIRIIDRDFNIIRANATLGRMFGLNPDQILGNKCYDLIQYKGCRNADCPHRRVIDGGTLSLEEERSFQTIGGKTLTCLISAAPYYNEEGELTGIIEGFRDISERKAMEERLRAISITDEMTGLLNRRGFMEIAGHQLQLAQRLGSTIFLIYADIDDFKAINDTLGHAVGDEAIKETACLFKETFRQADIIGIGRLGGDEFCALLFSQDFAPLDSHPIVNRLNQALARRNQETDQPYQLAVSIGLARYAPDNPCTLDELLGRADQAMYQCKQERKARQQAP